ncbi:MAG: polysaccharide deacetylase family protein [Armatimonadota bacterium]
MVAKAGLAYWLPRVAIIAVFLVVGFFVASKVMPISKAKPAIAESVKPRSEAELAALERLVTVTPPKTQQPFVSELKREKQAVVCFTWDATHSPKPILDGLAVTQVKAAIFVYGKDVEALKDALVMAKKAGHTIGSLGFAPGDLNALDRDQLDQSFKATNRALFEAMGERPRFFGVLEPKPKTDVIDYAAINGMVSLKLSLFDPRTHPSKIPSFALLGPDTAGRLSYSDVFDDLRLKGYKFSGLEEIFPIAKAGRM